MCCYWILNQSFCDFLWNWNILNARTFSSFHKLSQPCFKSSNVNLYQIAFPFSQNYDFYLSHQMFVCWRFYCQLFLMHFFLLLQRILYLRQNCFLESYYFSCWLPCALGWHPSWCEPFVCLSPAITIIINTNRKCNISTKHKPGSQSSSWQWCPTRCPWSWRAPRPAASATSVVWWSVNRNKLSHT